MEIAFETLELREACLEYAKASTLYGPDVALGLTTCIADLRAAVTTRDLLSGNPRVGTGNRQGLFVINILDGYEITLSPNQQDIPQVNGGIDWGKIKRFKVMGISK